MVYRLACPSCQKTSEHPFVRAGAVSVCGSCRTVWRIEPGHVARDVATPGAGGKTTGGDGVDLHEDAKPSRGPGVSGGSGAGDTAIVGLSGLSDVMRRGGVAAESVGDPGAEAEGIAPGRVASGPEVSASTPQVLAQRRSAEAARRRRRRTLLVLFMALAVMVGTLGVSVALLAAKQRAEQESEQADGGAGNPAEGALDSAEVTPPLRPARRLDLDDPMLLDAGRNDVRAVAEPGDDTALLAVRLIATEEAPPSPIELIVTATIDGRTTHAWTLTEPRPLLPGRGLRLFARLPDAPDDADPDGWIVTAAGPTD